MAKDYYDILGVQKNASGEEIKKAFHRLAHQHHPDKSGGDAERFKEINEAYQTLSDPTKRGQYDRFGSSGGSSSGMNWNDFQRAQQQGGFGYGQNVDMGDIGDIFGDIFGFGRSRQQARRRGSDVQVEFSVDFKDAVFGAEKTVELSGARVCDVCTGSGAEPGTSTVNCKACDGSGVIDRVQQTIIGGIRSQSVCERCGGSGKAPKTNCKHCHGTGSVRGKRQLKVTIPAGIDDAQSIRLEGQGEPGPRGSKPGDLYIRIRVRPDPKFRRDGDDILTRRTITVPEAALGTKIDVETIDGTVRLTIPAGTQSSKLFRLHGKGVTVLGRNSRGDQIVEIVVKVPEKLSREEKKLYESLFELTDGQ